MPKLAQPQAPKSPASKTDEVTAAARVLAIFVIPFLVAAAAILWFWPEDTGRLFAWPIKPNMTAFVLSTAYVGGIYFFTRVMRETKWHRVQVGFLPVATFSSLLGVATLLHWDRFSHGHVSFWAWAALYFAAPFLVLAVWWANRRHDPRTREPGDPALPRGLRLPIGVLGLATLAFGLWLFVSPSSVIPAWPWQLSPLTARVVAAIISMQGVALVGISRDERWSTASVMVEAQLLSTPLIVIAALRAHAAFQAAGASADAFAGALALSWLAMLALFAWMRLRSAELQAAVARAYAAPAAKADL